MSNNHHGQSQFELFPGHTRNSDEGQSSDFIHRNYSLSTENVIVIGIVFVLAVVLLYSFGVENGKQMILAKLGENKISVPKIEKDAIIVKPLSPESQLEADTLKVQEAVEAPKEKIIEIPVADLKAEKKVSLKETYTVQVASFKSEASARKEMERIKSFSKDVFLLPKGSYSVVCVGKFSRPEEAKALITKLKGRYNDCLVRRL